MAKYSMLIDLTRCVGCHGCTVACQAEYGLEPGQRFTKVERYEFGTFPEVGGAVITTQCMHCDQAPCVKVCPTGASYKRPDGLVMVDEEKCIGCRYCLTACPYDARTFNQERRVAQKCSFCYARVAEGKGPACAVTCMAGARIFGDTEDANSEISKVAARKKALRVPGTNIMYVVPKNLDRSLLPKDASVPGFVSLWKDTIQPAGKALMGATAGAVLLSLMVHSVKPKESHGNAADNTGRKGDGDGRK